MRRRDAAQRASEERRTRSRGGLGGETEEKLGRNHGETMEKTSNRWTER